VLLVLVAWSAALAGVEQQPRQQAAPQTQRQCKFSRARRTCCTSTTTPAAGSPTTAAPVQNFASAPHMLHSQRRMFLVYMDIYILALLSIPPLPCVPLLSALLPIHFLPRSHCAPLLSITFPRPSVAFLFSLQRQASDKHCISPRPSPTCIDPT
jgi:hypothetical protein